MKTPDIQHCSTMAEVRQHIDELDQRIVLLLAERSGYVAQAARIKQHADQVYDQARIDFIVERVKVLAAEQGGPPSVVEATYRAMIDAFIAFETREFARLREEVRT
jgi:isochorismate pyruvate lyase